MKIKWFPRSWIQLKSSSGYIIYIDPSYMSTYFKNYKNKIIFSEEEDDTLPEELEKGNMVLLSHIHKDHCKEVTIRRLSHSNTMVLTPKKYSKELDKNVLYVKAGDKYQFENILIEVVHAYNTSEGNSTRKVHNRGESVGYVINIDNKRIYFSGDTDLTPDMKELRNIDIAIIPIGGVFTMDVNEAVEAMYNMKPKIVIPVHHLKQNPYDYKQRMDEFSIDVIVPMIGEEIILN